MSRITNVVSRLREDLDYVIAEDGRTVALTEDGAARVESVDNLRELLAPWANSQALADDADGARGRQGSPAKVVLPEGWLALAVVLCK